MHNKMVRLQERLEVLKAEKKGAASIETIIVSGILIALAVGITTMFVGTLNKNAKLADNAIESEGVAANSAITATYGQTTNN